MVEHWHPASVAVLWLADLLLLALLWPVAGQASDVGAVLVMWAVPTAIVGAITLRWRRARAARRSP